MCVYKVRRFVYNLKELSFTKIREISLFTKFWEIIFELKILKAFELRFLIMANSPQLLVISPESGGNKILNPSNSRDLKSILYKTAVRVFNRWRG